MTRWRMVTIYRGMVVRKTEWFKIGEYIHYTVSVEAEIMRKTDSALGGPPERPMPVRVRVEFE